MVLLLAHGALMGYDMRWAQAGSATINITISLTGASWLRKQGPGERFTGILLVLAGINQFNFVVHPGDAGALTQTAVANVLRLMLAMSLMYAALTRSAEAAGGCVTASSSSPTVLRRAWPWCGTSMWSTSTPPSRASTA